ncbi:MAG: CBS domain-containing protein [Planctomycetes bacterium]|nr:CBS domain-containing protein [Planctomycetota bacterium]
MADLSQILVQDVFSQSPIVLEETMTLGDAYEALVGESISGAPVTNAAGDLIGVLSASDVLIALAPLLDPQQDAPVSADLQELKNALLSEHVQGPALTCTENTTLVEAFALMHREGVHRLVVVARDEIRGVISSLDVVRAVALAGKS